MSVFICVATTANGMIDTPIPHAEWISDASWQSYLEQLKGCEVAIVGSKTYDVMSDEEFLPKVQYIVLTHHTDETYRPNVLTSQESPAQLIARLHNQGYKRIAILGGAEVIGAYLQAGVVDELFVDIASVLSGGGKPLLPIMNNLFTLELLAVKRLDSQTAQLHYRVCSR